MKKLLIATHNPAKFFEIKHFLQDLPLKLISLKEMGIKEDVKKAACPLLLMMGDWKLTI